METFLPFAKINVQNDYQYHISTIISPATPPGLAHSFLILLASETDYSIYADVLHEEIAKSHSVYRMANSLH